MPQKNAPADHLARWSNVRARSVSSQIVNNVRESLFRGELKPGDFLGSENDLAQKLGVNEEKAEAIGATTASAAAMAGGWRRGRRGGAAGGFGSGGQGGRGNRRLAKKFGRWLRDAEPIPERVSKPPRDRDPRPGIIRRRPIEPSTKPPQDPPKRGPYR